MKQLPEIRREGNLTWLIVDGEPMYILGAQTANYQATNLKLFEQNILPNLLKLHCNTLLLPVYWQLLEPQEGVYDFSLLDGMIEICRRNDLKLIPLWFGLWKSTFATYAPSWVKRNNERFTRIHKADGLAINSFSPYCAQSVETDARAFAAMMRHLKETDSEEQTVIMVQCENECGMFRTDRDYSPEANALFAAEVPTEIAAVYGKGTWTEVFGADAAEAFSSWGFAQAVQQIAIAGKAAYDLPIFLNAWLELPDNGPGYGYPSGGCISKFMKIWQAAAPALDALSPNAYGNFRATCDSYADNGNPLLIPESGGLDAPANMFYSFGKHNALCYCPFGAEHIYGGRGFGPFHSETAAPAFTAAYDAIAELAPILQKAHREGRVWGFMEDESVPQFIDTEKYRINFLYKGRKSALVFDGGFPGMGGGDHPVGKGGGILIQEDEDTFLLLGVNVELSFQPRPGTSGMVDYDWIDDGHYENHEWVPGLIYTGDTAADCMTLREIPSMLRICAYLYH